MNGQPLFTLSISDELNSGNKQRLIDIVSEIADVNQPSHHKMAPGWEMFIAVAKDVGVVAGAASALVKLASEIIAWRKAVREVKEEPRVKLHQPNKEALDLAEAKDEEILDWITKKE